MQSFFTTLSNTVKQANKDIDAAKLKLTTEIAAIGEIKTETETARFYVDYDDLMLSLLKEAAQKMINTCNEYQKDTVRRHSLRYLKSDKRLFSLCTQGIKFITFKNTDVF